MLNYDEIKFMMKFDNKQPDTVIDMHSLVLSLKWYHTLRSLYLCLEFMILYKRSLSMKGSLLTSDARLFIVPFCALKKHMTVQCCDRYYVKLTVLFIEVGKINKDSVWCSLIAGLPRIAGVWVEIVPAITAPLCMSWSFSSQEGRISQSSLFPTPTLVVFHWHPAD